MAESVPSSRTSGRADRALRRRPAVDGEQDIVETSPRAPPVRPRPAPGSPARRRGRRRGSRRGRTRRHIATDRERRIREANLIAAQVETGHGEAITGGFDALVERPRSCSAACPCGTAPGLGRTGSGGRGHRQQHRNGLGKALEHHFFLPSGKERRGVTRGNRRRAGGLGQCAGKVKQANHRPCKWAAPGIGSSAKRIWGCQHCTTRGTAKTEQLNREFMMSLKKASIAAISRSPWPAHRLWRSRARRRFVGSARSGASTENSELRGGFIIPLVAVVAVILGILALTGGGGDHPSSP